MGVIPLRIQQLPIWAVNLSRCEFKSHQQRITMLACRRLSGMDIHVSLDIIEVTAMDVEPRGRRDHRHGG